MSELSEEEKYPTPFVHADGSTAHLFSPYNKKTLERHFLGMQQYGIDGVFLQRFATSVIINPLSPALQSSPTAAARRALAVKRLRPAGRSGPTAGSGAICQKQIPSNNAHCPPPNVTCQTTRDSLS